MLGFLDINLAGTGLITGHKLAERLYKHIGNANIEDLPRRFTVVATEIGTGHEVWLSRGASWMPCVRFTSYFGLFRPVKLDGALDAR